MHTPDLKRRPLTGKSLLQSTVSDNTRKSQSPDAAKSSGLLFSSLIDFDVLITSYLGLCANSKSVLGFLRPVMIFLEWTCHGVPWIAGTIVSILISHDRTMLQIFLNLLMALIVDLLVVVVLKVTFKRNRPAHNIDDMLVMDSMAVARVDRHSFPSGHATRAVMTALFIINKFDLTGRLRTLTLSWMVAIPVSRVLLGRHHVLDVFVGVICGFLQYLVIVNYLWLSEQTCMDILQPIHEDLHL